MLKAKYLYEWGRWKGHAATVLPGSNANNTCGAYIRRLHCDNVHT